MEEDNAVDVVDITDTQIPDGFVLTQKHDAAKYEIGTVVSGNSGEEYELVIGNKEGEEEKEYVLRNCRKISDTDCAGYFFEGVCQKT